MLKIYKKGGARGSLSDVNKTFTWIDLVTPSESEVQQIAKITELTAKDLHEFYDTAEKPKVVKNKNYLLIIYKTLTEQKKAESFAIFILKNSVITLRKNHSNFNEAVNSVEDKKQLVFHLLDIATSRYFAEFETIQEKIGNIESEVIETPTKKIVGNIFETRKQLLLIHKALIANRDAVVELELEARQTFGLAFADSLRYIYYDLVQLIDSSDTYREMITTTLEIYGTSISNNLNSVMKTLTIITALLLFPTLIAAIYGMNFQHTPEFSWKYGYAWAWFLMIFSAIFLLIVFKSKGWIGKGEV